MHATAKVYAASFGVNRNNRVLWLVLLSGFGVALSPLFACATPFAALATVAAVKLGRREAVTILAFVWLANQLIGYCYLGYPRTWDSLAWGLAIGAAIGAAALAASSLSTARPAPLAVSLPFVAAFVAFEMALYTASFILPGGQVAFTAGVVWHILLINAVTLCGLMATYQLTMLLGQLVRSNSAITLTAGTTSSR